MRIKEHLWYILQEFLQVLSTFLRQLLGPRGVCIYVLSCRAYAREVLRQYPLYKAVFLIGVRLMMCNPFTAIWWKRKEK